MLGTTPDRVILQTKVTDNQTLVQLNIDDGDLPALVRDLPLPLEAAETLQATFVEGHLHLRWRASPLRDGLHLSDFSTHSREGLNGNVLMLGTHFFATVTGHLERVVQGGERFF